MTTIRFSYAGQKFKTEVPEGFKDLPEETQRNRILTSLNAKYGDKPVASKEDKNILDYIALIERPSQALKVGLKESALGGAVYRGLGGVDLTPSEGFFTGLGKGWMGKDEIRTQDALPDDMNPILKGVLGFAGDVATDPLTWWGPAAVGKVGQGIKYAGAKTGATPALKKAGQAALEVPVLPKNFDGGRTVRDVLRSMNVATGKGKEVKGLAGISDTTEFHDKIRIALSTGVDDLERFFNARAEELGVGADQVKEAFRIAMEREHKVKTVLNKDGEIQYREDDTGSFLLDRDGNKVPKQVIEEKKPIGTAQQKILGDEGVGFVDEWAEIFEESARYSEAFGQPIRQLTSKGYFPRVITKEWRDTLDDIDIHAIEDIDDVGDATAPIFGANYRSPREAYRELHIDEASTNLKRDYSQKYADTVGGTRNPAEVDFFELDPIKAMGSRLDRQARALQRKWFIDEVTDSGYGIGSIFTRKGTSKLQQVYGSLTGLKALDKNHQPTREFLDKVWDLSRGDNSFWKGTDVENWTNAFKPEREIGLWVKKITGKDGNTVYHKRELNPEWRGRTDKVNDQFVYTPMSKDEQAKFINVDKYEPVSGIPEGYISTKVWNDAFDLQLVDSLESNNIGRTLAEAIENSKLRDTDEILRFVKEEVPNVNAQTLKNINLSIDEARAAAKQRVDLKTTSREVFYAPSVIKRQIEDTLDVMSGPNRDNEFINFYDKLQNTWKSWSLGVRPAYHSRNAIGNMWNAYMIAGVHGVQPFIDAAKLQYYGRFGGSEAKRLELINNMGGAKGAIHNVHKIKDRDWNQKFANTDYTMEELYTAARLRGVTAGHYTKDTIREMELALNAKTGKGNIFERYIGPENPMVRGGFAIGGTIEGNARFGVFINVLQRIKNGKGNYEWTAPDGKKFKLSEKTPEGYFKTETVPYKDRHININTPITKRDMEMDIAAQEVKAALFDYGDLSRFEQNVLKRFMPFYTWSRKNIPAQFKGLIQNPERAEKLAIAKQQFEHETGELDYSDYGKFWGDRVPVFFGNENDGVIKAFTLLNLLPMADLQRMITPKELVSDLATPLIKQPLEQIANYDTFMKRAIKSEPGETQDFLGVKLPPRLHHLAKLLVPLSDINRLNPAGVFGENIVDPATGLTTTKSDAYFGLGSSRESYKDINEQARWVRFFSGVPSYDVNLKRSRYFMNKNLKKDISELKGRIKWAAKKGESRKLENLMRLLEAVEKGETLDPFERRS